VKISETFTKPETGKTRDTGFYRS